jgi:hypothetical protein
MTAEQWSLLLYGYTTNESIIDPIIDKLLIKTSFQTAIEQYHKIVLLTQEHQSDNQIRSDPAVSYRNPMGSDQNL